MRKRWGVFLDRDGVINEEVGYLDNPQALKLIPGAVQAIRQLNRVHIPVIVVTNQAGVARGYFPEQRVHEIHETLSRLLAAEGAYIDRYYYCPHHPTEGFGPYRLDCKCRKPKPGMLFKAAEEFGLDLKKCYLIGDKALDIETGWRAGTRTILVLTGYGEEMWRNWPFLCKPDHIARNLQKAVEWILEVEELPLL
jgi:D-glycero-D-manno-heptose 1,7-bisphosphate phosphatase